MARQAASEVDKLVTQRREIGAQACPVEASDPVLVAGLLETVMADCSSCSRRPDGCCLGLGDFVDRVVRELQRLGISARIMRARPCAIISGCRVPIIASSRMNRRLMQPNESDSPRG